ncbi:MAG: universal stress protein [Anaerolinea sp. 4484_236]|nr:MAG: universal stress protein [Anaerolinea sp. 4484_236]
MYKNILLAVDGSSHSLRAAQAAAELARCLNANLWIVVAFEPVPAYLGEPNLQHMISARLDEANELLEKALEIVGEIPGELKTEVLEGPAAEAILDVADVRGNDLIVIGSRGRGKLRGLLLGSQSQKVLQHAPCPVLMVK